MNLADAHKCGVLDDLRFELFRNPAYSNAADLRSFTAQIYRFAVVENIYPLNTAPIKDRFVTGMYDWFSPFQDFSFLERYDRLNFFKAFVNLKITCDFTYGFSSEQIGFGIILQFPLD